MVPNHPRRVVQVEATTAEYLYIRANYIKYDYWRTTKTTTTTMVKESTGWRGRGRVSP